MDAEKVQEFNAKDSQEHNGTCCPPININIYGFICWPAGIKPLSDLFAPSFEILFHQGHELIGDGAVDEAVIVTERQMHDGANRN